MTDAVKKLRSEHIARNPIIYLGILAVIALWTWAWFFFTPLQADDLAFQSYFLDYLQRDGSPIQAWWECSLWHRADSNGRLGDFVAPLVTTYLPPWLFSLISAGVLVWLLQLLVRMILTADGEGRPTPQLRVLMLLWPVALVLWPWRDYLSYPVYALNYLYSTAFAATGMWMWLKLLRGERGIWLTIGAAAAWLLGGMTHEGIGVPMLAAALAVIVLRRGRIPLPAWLAVAALLAGTLESSLAPGTLKRAGFEQIAFDWLKNTRLMFKHCTLMAVLALLAAALATGRRGRGVLKAMAAQPMFIMAVVNLLVGAAICFKLDNATPRYGWVTQVYSCVAIGMICCRLGWFEKRWIMWGVLVADIAAVLLMAGTLIWQKRFYDDDMRIRNELAQSPTGTVFTRNLTKKDLPVWLLRIPNGGMWQNTFQHRCYNLRFPRPDGRPWAVLPAELVYFKPEGTPYPGEGAVYRAGDFYIATLPPPPVENRPFWIPQLVCTLADGSQTMAGAEFIDFTADDGRHYIYLGEDVLPENTVKVDYEPYPL